MHKSNLAGFIIDCQTDDLTQAADFWAGRSEEASPGQLLFDCHKFATHLT
jgi:hypothetical protein